VLCFRIAEPVIIMRDYFSGSDKVFIIESIEALRMGGLQPLTDFV